MRFEIVEIQDGDVVIITLDIGNLPTNEIDKYVNRCMKPLQETFGCEIAVLPVREGGWNFTIIRNPHRKPPKLKKVDVREKL